MEKLVYLVWDRPSRAPAELRRLALDEIGPGLAAAGATRLEVHVDDEDADVAGPMPAPGTELPLRLAVSLWLPAHDRRAGIDELMGSVGVRTSGYLVTESTWSEYGENGRRGPRDWPAGERSPGITTFATLRRNPALDPRTFRELWHGHQSPMSEAVQPRLRYVRNTVVHPVTPGAPPFDALVTESWSSADLVADVEAFHDAVAFDQGSAVDAGRAAENLRVMLDSVSQIFDMASLRSEAMSEYLLWD